MSNVKGSLHLKSHRILHKSLWHEYLDCLSDPEPFLSLTTAVLSTWTYSRRFFLFLWAVIYLSVGHIISPCDMCVLLLSDQKWNFKIAFTIWRGRPPSALKRNGMKLRCIAVMCVAWGISPGTGSRVTGRCLSFRHSETLKVFKWNVSRSIQNEF